MGKANLRQGWRVASVLRHGAGGESWCRRGRSRRHAGRYCRDARSFHRECRPSDSCSHSSPPCRRCRNSGCIGRCNSLFRAEFAMAPMLQSRLALGADAVSIGTAALIALGDNDPHLEEEYRALGTTAGAYDDWHEGRDPAGITTQDPDTFCAPRSDNRWSESLRITLSVLTLEAQTIARSCGKSPRSQSRARRSGRAHRRSGRDGASAACRHKLDSRAGQQMSDG